MKKIKLTGKLTLNKSKVSELNRAEAHAVVGGSCKTVCFCDITKPKCAPITAPTDCIVLTGVKCASLLADCPSVRIACIPRTEIDCEY